MTGDVFPCALRRQDCLVGRELGRRMMIDASSGDRGASVDPTSTAQPGDVDLQPDDAAKLQRVRSRRPPQEARLVDIYASLSRLESVLITYPPILESLLLHLPTCSLLNLYHTSKPLRTFLRSYPLAWKTLSFRQLPHDLNALAPSSGTQSPDAGYASSRPNALDLLLRVILPFGTRLTRLDLDNTAVSGSELYSRVLDGRRATLQHLSVRNCKMVSLKYHILPYLQMQVSIPKDSLEEPPLALKSLYTYRCRHHRRRPYLPASLSRRDSDSQPTHQLVQTCYYLGIWTDTGWCTTPGPRCFRRRDYACGRVASDSNAEIWVPFDRLWRSQNFVGRCDGVENVEGKDNSTCRADLAVPKLHKPTATNVRLWEEQEHGYFGEALGAGISSPGEGKEVPGHLRKSHTTFVQGFKCHSCGDKIQERCEQCSIRMHCVGCRRTLCASCTFDRPLRAKRRKKMHETAVLHALNALGAADVLPPLSNGDIESKMNRRAGTRLWWAPGATRSPNKISEVSSDDEEDSDQDDDDSIDQDGQPSRPAEPQITSRWCCQRLDFSGGGGVNFQGNFHQGANVRAAPLPAGQGFEDPVFPSPVDSQCGSEGIAASCEDEEDDSYPPYVPPPCNADQRGRMKRPRRTRKIQPFSTIPYIERASREGVSLYTAKTFPRNLCKPCYDSPKWKVRCAFQDCQVALCIEHDIKTLQVRQCGFRRLDAECRSLRRAIPLRYFYAKWRPVAQEMQKYDFRREEAPADDAAISGSDGMQTSSRRVTQRSPPSVSSETTLSRQTSSTHRAMDNTPARTRSLSAGYRHNSASPTPKPPALRVSSHDDSSIATAHAQPRLPYLPKFREARRFTGCSRLFCLAPDDRLPSDTRPNCPCWEYLIRCRECGVYACFDCSGLEMGCTCAACQIDWRKFQCPACQGDRQIGEQVKRATEELVARGERWKAEDRGRRFWRCRLEEEARALRESEAASSVTREEVERERRDLFRELPGRDDTDGDDDDIDDIMGDVAAAV